MALKTYSQLIKQMKVPNDGHDNISDSNKKLRNSVFFDKTTAQLTKSTPSVPFKVPKLLR
ncbi:MAG: hypothetical protein U0103_04690 [Candidatus Obscuribacterales bacterium]